MARKRSPSRYPPLLQQILWRCALVLATGFVQLPFDWQVGVGRTLGFIFARLPSRRRKIVETNLRLCFPELSAQQRKMLRNDVFCSVGISLIETLFAWLGKPASLVDRVTIHGDAELRAVQQLPQPILLLGAHFATLDLAGALLAQFIELGAIYRYNKNLLIEELMMRGRQRLYTVMLEREDTKGIVRSLQAQHTIWYAADQDYGAKHSIFVPFFGVPAATITAPMRLARLTGAKGFFLEHHRTRNDDGRWGIELRLTPLPANWPSGDNAADAAVVARMIEQGILRDPAQYLWMHRRFKTRPEGESRFY